MQPTNIAQHISGQFNLELEEIHDKVLAMGGLVEQQFLFAIQAFINCETEPAEKVICQTSQVDDYEIAINKECTEILARRQPEAFDLRLLIVIIKTITELQRISHITAHIARRAIQSCSIDKKSEKNCELQHIYDIVKDMLHHALETYALIKKDHVLEVTAEEDTVNREYTLIFQQLIARTIQDSLTIKHAIYVLFTLRDIERIAENTVVISKNVFYLLGVENVEHKSE